MDKSIETKELHPENIKSILVKDEVLIFKKLIDSKDMHPKNIELVFFTNDESKLDKSIDTKKFIL